MNDKKSLEEINVKLLMLDSLSSSIEDQLCSAGAEHMSDALGRATDLFYIHWSQPTTFGLRVRCSTS